jgi:hypothetical protein
LTEHLSGLIQALCSDEYISDVRDNFRVVTGGSYRTAWFHLRLGKNRKGVALKLQELLYLNILYLVLNQVGRYSGAMVDVMNYSAAALAPSEFIEPQPHYTKQFQYSQLYAELKAFILI